MKSLRETLKVLWEKGHSGMYEGAINQAIAEIRSLVPEEKDTFGDDYKKCIGFNDCVNKILERMGG